MAKNSQTQTSATPAPAPASNGKKKVDVSALKNAVLTVAREGGTAKDVWARLGDVKRNDSLLARVVWKYRLANTSLSYRDLVENRIIDVDKFNEKYGAPKSDTVSGASLIGVRVFGDASSQDREKYLTSKLRSIPALEALVPTAAAKQTVSYNDDLSDLL